MRQGISQHAPTKALLLATALAAPFAGAPALAQVAEEATVDSNTIIVTAQRRAEALEDVPMTVSVVTPQTLTDAGVNSIRDLANVTTGFQVGNSGSVPQPAIRGITTTNAGSYENNVALFVDGLYQTTPAILNMDLPNVQDIQILKGPQGTLYGRNATGGAILINTIEPGNTWTGNIEATYGRFDDRRARGYIAGPLGEGVGLSVSGTLRHTDGYYKKASRTTPGQFDGNTLGLKQETIRAKLKFDLSDSFSATLGYNYLHASDPRGVLFTPIENVALPYTTPGRNTRPREMGQVAGDLFDLDQKQHEGLLKLELQTGVGMLRSVTGYASARNSTYFDFGGNYSPDGYSGSVILDKTFQESIDFTVDAIDKVDLIVGGNYYKITSRFGDGAPNSNWSGPVAYSPFTYPDPATTLIPIGDPRYRLLAETFFWRTKQAWAVFADATFHATDRLTITLGGRYSEETQDVSGTKNNYCVDPLAAAAPQRGCGPIGAVLPGAAGVPYTRASSAKSSNYSKFTPRASIRYEITPGTNIYASYSQGFRSGEWNSVLPGDNPANWVDAKQETVDAFEIGLKSAGRRFHFEVAGFYYDYRDLQVSNTQAVGTPPVALVILTNAPKAEIYGAEASFDYEVVDNLTVRGGVTWLHARYGDGFVLNGTGVNPAAAGFNVNSDPLKTFQNASLAQNLSGLQMARAPNFAGFVGFDYLIPQGDGGLRLSANLKYSSSYVVTNPSVWGGEPLATFNPRYLADPKAVPNNAAILTGTPYVGRANEQRARQGAYALLNASVTWTDPTDHYYIRVWGNNLTDVKYRTHYNPLVGSGTYQPIAEPLTFGGTVGYKF